MAMNNPKYIPHAVEDITEEWLQTVFQLHNPEYKSVKVETLDHITEKNGYLSTVFKGLLLVSKTDESSSATELINIFIKFSSRSEEFTDMVNSSGCDITEVETYRKVFRDLRDFEYHQAVSKPRVLGIIPEHFGSDFDESEGNRGYYLLLRDLSPDFDLADFDRGLSVNQIEVALKKLCVFHITSYAWSVLEGPDFGQMYSGLVNKFTESEEMEEYAKVCADDWIRHLGFTGDKKETLVRFAANYRRLHARAFGAEAEERFLCNGDMWANNILFNKSGSDCFLVDWQFLSHRSVFWDIASTIFVALSPQALESNLDSLLKTYHDEVLTLCPEFKVEAPWDWDTFKQSVQSVGLFYGLCWALPSYEMAKKYPSYEARFEWIYSQCLEKCPEMLTL